MWALVSVGDLQEVLEVVPALNKAAEQQQNPPWRNGRCAGASPVVSMKEGR